MHKAWLLLVAVVALAAVVALVLFVRPGLPSALHPPPPSTPQSKRCFLVIEGPGGYPVRINGTEYTLPVRLEYTCPLARFELLANETYRLNETHRYVFEAWRLGEKRVESRAARLTAVYNTTLVLEAKLEAAKLSSGPRLVPMKAADAIDWSRVELLKGTTGESWGVRDYAVYAGLNIVKLPLKRPLRIVRIDSIILKPPMRGLRQTKMFFVYSEGERLRGVYILVLSCSDRSTVHASLKDVVSQVLPQGKYLFVYVELAGEGGRLNVDLDWALKESMPAGINYSLGRVEYIAITSDHTIDFERAVFWVLEEG